MAPSLTPDFVNVQATRLYIEEVVRDAVAALLASDAIVVASPSGLPTGVVNGTEAVYLADATNGVYWRFRYNSAEAGPYKWYFIGGGSLYAEVVTTQAVDSAVYIDLATVGPSITIPLAGDYEIAIGSGMSLVANGTLFASYAIGATAAVDADSCEMGQVAHAATEGYLANITRVRRKTITAANTALVMKYRESVAGTGSWFERWIQARPIRVG